MDQSETAEVKQNSEVPILMEEAPVLTLRGVLWIVAFVGLGIVLMSSSIGKYVATTFEAGNVSRWNPDEVKSNTTIAQVFGGLLFLGTLLELSVQRIVSAIQELKATDKGEEKP